MERYHVLVIDVTLTYTQPITEMNSQVKWGWLPKVNIWEMLQQVLPLRKNVTSINNWYQSSEITQKQRSQHTFSYMKPALYDSATVNRVVREIVDSCNSIQYKLLTFGHVFPLWNTRLPVADPAMGGPSGPPLTKTEGWLWRRDAYTGANFHVNP